MFENFKGQIIWSADGISLKKLLKVIGDNDFPREHVAVKLDRVFFEIYGRGAISKVQALGVPVFADAKLIEIPYKVNRLTELYLKHKPWMLNVMADICNNGNSVSFEKETLDALAQFSESCKVVGTLSCAVTILTSKTEELVQKEYGKTTMEAVDFLARLAIECGVTDIVCSPLEAPVVRAIDEKVDIDTPGVRLPESDADDQSRIMTPVKSLDNGATRLVIGRDLSRDGKFAENYLKIMANIEGRQS